MYIICQKYVPCQVIDRHGKKEFTIHTGKGQMNASKRS